jgi:hypothetical protein
VTGPLQLFTNNAISILDQNLSPTDTVIHLAQNYGPLFPIPQNPGEFFLVTLETTAAPFHREIVRIDHRVGDDLHVAPGGRAQEGTTAQAWTAGLTIVDHRITAETIRQAFLQPVSSGGTGGAGGIVYPSTTVPATTTQAVSDVSYSDTERLKKYWIEMYDPLTGNSQALEILVIISGILNLNNETADYVQSHRIGYNFKGSVQISLDVVNKKIALSWHNAEPTADVIVTITSI